MSSIPKQPKVIVVMPAYNAARTLEKVYRGIPKNKVNKILLIDDKSVDNTVKISRKLKIKTIVHKKNQGYGANQRTCYTEALKLKADFVIMLHPDGQYDPKDIVKFINKYKKNHTDLILGSRFLKGGDRKTPFYKSISIRVITGMFNAVLGTSLSEANTGYRGFSRRLLQTIPWQKNGNGYIFDPQLIIQARHYGFTIGDVPIFKDYHDAASSTNFMTSLRHGIENLQLLGEYILHRLNIRKAQFLTQ